MPIRLQRGSSKPWTMKTLPFVNCGWSVDFFFFTEQNVCISISSLLKNFIRYPECVLTQNFNGLKCVVFVNADKTLKEFQHPSPTPRLQTWFYLFIISSWLKEDFTFCSCVNSRLVLSKEKSSARPVFDSGRKLEGRRNHVPGVAVGLKTFRKCTSRQSY